MFQNKKKSVLSSFKYFTSLVVCFQGHGDQGVVISVYNGIVSLNAIQCDAFDDNTCPDFRNNPKIFIILSCQGGESMKAIKRKNNEISMPRSMPV